MKTFALLVLCWASIGCSADKETAQATTTDLEPGPGAFDPAFTTSAAFFTRMSAPARGLASSPHGGKIGVVQIFYSKNIESVITASALDAPLGTVAVKTQDPDGDGTINNIMVMIKKAPGFDAAAGDWLYERYAADGTLDVSGGAKLAFCSTCHNGYSATSQLAGTSLAN
jgi:hypothetical protein